MNAPVEITTRFATAVSDLPAAWAFVMERIDKVGANPSVRISPVWVVNDQELERTRYFSVVVEGMVSEK